MNEQVPIFNSYEQKRKLWEEAEKNDRALIAVRDGERGYIVLYDYTTTNEPLKQHIVSELRNDICKLREYDVERPDPISQDEQLGGSVNRFTGQAFARNLEEAERLYTLIRSSIQD
jgi:hypothetical protein